MNLEEEKLKEEIKKIRRSKYVDYSKIFAIVIGSVVLFITVQMPESLLNKKISKESISRERAKLVFEIIHNNNTYENILLELSVIEKAYPDKDNYWINEIKEVYLTRIEKSKNAIDNTYNTEITALKVELDKLLDKKEMLQTQLVSAMSRRGGRIGFTGYCDNLKSQICELDDSIRNRKIEIDSLKAKNGKQ